MISMSPAYQAAVVADTRHTVVRAEADIVSPDIVYGASVSSGDAPTSIPAQLHDKVKELSNPYATFELNRWALNGSKQIYTPGQLQGQQGWASDTLCGADGAFNPPVYIQQNVSGVSILQIVSVAFGDGELDGLPTDYMVSVMSGSTVAWSKRVTGPTDRVRVFSGFTVTNPTAIRVTVYHWSLPYRRARVAELYPGIYEVWDNGDITAVAIKQQGDPSCITLPYGTLSLTLNNATRRFDPGAKDSIFRSLEERQTIKVYMGVTLPDESAALAPVGAYYQYQNGWKTGSNDMAITWNMVDIVGLVAGRAYAAPDVLPTTLQGWLTSICVQLGENFRFRAHVAASVANTPVIANDAAAVNGRNCGELVRFACMAAGAWARASNDGGALLAEAVGSGGGSVTMGNLSAWPSVQANSDVARIDFTVNPAGADAFLYSVAGNRPSCSTTLSINNPFIHTTAQADAAAALILACYGGNKVNTTGRGNPAQEIGDLDAVQLNPGHTVQGRRIYQTLNIQSGVLSGCQSNFLVSDEAMAAQGG